MANKVYADGLYLKQVNTKYGPLMTASIDADRFIKFIKANTNERGRVNLNLPERREPGQYGDTHYAVLDTFEPKGEGKTSAKKQQYQDDGDDDLPF